MDKNFLQLRDFGCQGAWEIFLRARDMLQDVGPERADGPSIGLCLTPEEAWQTPLWLESVHRAGGRAIVLSTKGELSVALADGAPDVDMVVAGGVDPGVLDVLAHTLAMPMINAGNAKARPCQVMADLLTLVQRLGPTADKLDAVRVSWIGAADGEQAGLVNSWLDMALCFRHELFLAFPQGHEPDGDHLDFAMNAGGKVFLSYDPGMAIDGTHALVVGPWSYQEGSVCPRHPLAADAALAERAGQTPIFSFSKDLPVPDALRAEREQALIVCQTALVEHMNCVCSQARNESMD